MFLLRVVIFIVIPLIWFFSNLLYSIGVCLQLYNETYAETTLANCAKKCFLARGISNGDGGDFCCLGNFSLLYSINKALQRLETPILLRNVTSAHTTKSTSSTSSNHSTRAVSICLTTSSSLAQPCSRSVSSSSSLGCFTSFFVQDLLD
jgi:hypothetical protein